MQKVRSTLAPLLKSKPAAVQIHKRNWSLKFSSDETAIRNYFAGITQLLKAVLSKAKVEFA